MNNDRTDIKATLEGDLDAFGRIVDRHQQNLRGFITILGVSRDDVDDVAQQTFVAAYTSLPKFQADSDFGVWLRGIARNMSRKHFRKLGRQEFVPLQDFLLEHASETQELPDERRSQRLRGCIGKLSEKYRAFVQMRYFKKYTADQIGEHFDIAASTVRVLQGRIRLQLRKCMEAGEELA